MARLDQPFDRNDAVILLLLLLILVATPTFGATPADGRLPLITAHLIVPARTSSLTSTGIRQPRSTAFGNSMEGSRATSMRSRCIGGCQAEDLASLSRQPRTILSMPWTRTLGAWSGVLCSGIRCRDRRCHAAISIRSASPERQ
jgi:hypothetical protein